MPPPSVGVAPSPFSVKAASTDSLTTDDLQLDIALRIHERIYEFLLSLALPFFSEEPPRHTNALGKKEERGEATVGE